MNTQYLRCSTIVEQLATTELITASMAKRPTIDVTFGPFNLSFPNVTAPDEKYGVYTANGVGDPNSAEMKHVKSVLADALKTFDLDPAEAKLPLVKEMTKDPNAPANSRKPKKIATGKLVLKSKSQRPPAVFDSKGKEINPKGLDIRGGTLARVQGFISPYDMNGNEGISFTLTGVQIIRLAEGRKSAGFGAFDTGEEGGFEAGEFTAGGDELAIGDDGDSEDAADDNDAAEDDGGILDI